MGDAFDNYYDNVPDSLPNEVWAAKEDWVKVSMKHMTARRMVGWLRAFAEYADVGGNTTSADHARAVADRLEAQVEATDDP